jgi:peptidyl-tRNA hydrolase
MTTEPFISAHEDPEGESPWALQCVVNESAEFSENALSQATALAVLNFLDEARTNPEWASAVARWKQGRIRKILRRARNSKWDKLANEAGVTTTHHGVTVRVFVPSAMDSIPPAIKKCQVSGITATENEYLPSTNALPFLAIFSNRSLSMSPGKAAVACAHVAQLMSEQLLEEDYAEWKSLGFPLWASTLGQTNSWIEQFADVVIHDGGLTEVEPGSITAIGIWNTRAEQVDR